MSDEVLSLAPIQQLLKEADAMVMLLEELGGDATGASNIGVALDQIYSDLGRAIHEALPQTAAYDEEEHTDIMSLSEVTARLQEMNLSIEGITRVPEGIDEPDPETEEDDLILEPLDEDTLEVVHDDPDRTMPFGIRPLRHDADEEITSVLRAEQMNQAILDGQRAGSVDDDEDTSVTVGLRRIQAMASESTATTRAGRHHEVSGWQADLGELLELVALPQDLDDPAEFAAEAACIQWSTVALPSRWQAYPKRIQLSLLGLLACRARALRERLAVRAAPDLALQRLNHYRRAHQLSKVKALDLGHQPELGSWNEDARHWWDALVQGART